MSFTVLIPARLASSRLPNKPLADIAGLPMVVRVAQRAALAQTAGEKLRVVVAADSEQIVSVCQAHHVEAVLTRTDHASGSDRLAQACDLLGLEPQAVVVNVQGDEPLVAPELIRAVARLLIQNPDTPMSTAAHRIESVEEFCNPNVVKVVVDASGKALLFSRAPIPWWRDGSSDGTAQLPTPRPLRHIGIYGYRAGFLRTLTQLSSPPLETTESLEQLRAMWHGHRIAVHLSSEAPGPGVDTPQDLERVRQLFRVNPPAA